MDAEESFAQLSPLSSSLEGEETRAVNLAVTAGAAAPVIRVRGSAFLTLSLFFLHHFECLEYLIFVLLTFIYPV